MWNNSVITDGGMAVLTQWISGGTLTVTGAKLGSGTVSSVLLARQTNVSEYKGNASIIASERVDTGMQFTVRIDPLTAECTVRQIGIFGKIGSGTETMIAIYQDDTGIVVPSSTSMPEFVYDFLAVVATQVGSSLTVNVDATTHATIAQVNAKQDIISDLSDIRYRANAACNPNLLDNWYFANPVNQRGFTASTATSGWTIDRWRMSKSSAGSSGVSFNSPYLLLNGTDSNTFFIQKVSGYEKLTDKKVTLSMLMTDGTIKVSAPFSFADNTYRNIGTDSVIQHKITAAGELTLVCLSGKAARILAVKLELGEKQTLARYDGATWVLNEIPDYGEQLRRCQRYYYQSWNGSLSNNAYGAVSFITNGYMSYPGFRFPADMAASPSVAVYSWNTQNAGEIRNWVDSANVTDIRITYVCNKGFALYKEGGLPANKILAFQYTATVSGYGG